MNREKGFTLVELLLALAIGSIISTVAVISIFNVMDNSTRTQDSNKVIGYLDVAALQIRKDGIVTQESNLVEGTPKTLNKDTPGGNITLSWTDYSGFDDPEKRDHNIVYTITPGGLLQRVYDSGNVTVVGRNINRLTITQNGRMLDVTIRGASGIFPETVKSLNFKIYRRSEGLQ